MKPPQWLAELHRQWLKARGGKLGGNARPFSRTWDDLLEEAGVRSAEDKDTALREAKAFEKQALIKLKSYGVRSYLIERITLPLTSEAWLREQFGSVEASRVREQSLAIAAAAKAIPHPRYPQLWSQWCDGLVQAFGEGRNLRPLNWRQPALVEKMISVIRGLTETEWAPGTSIRVASAQVIQDSKALERHQRGIESALAAFFGNVTSLQALGLTSSSGHVWLAGPMVLHFEDGGVMDFSASRDRYAISHADLSRATAIATTTQRLLTVENEKATFKDIAAANTDRSTLVAASSFPTEALRILLQKLPAALPRYHFGDTDPAGWLILLKMREASPREVLPLHMRWRPAPKPSPLTARDLELLPGLITSPLMQDCRTELEMLMARNDRGNFEQESLGIPGRNWPFY